MHTFLDRPDCKIIYYMKKKNWIGETWNRQRGKCKRCSDRKWVAEMIYSVVDQKRELAYKNVQI